MAESPVVNVVLGTAGHIDHGKTALVHALTGIDADRFREEKERGMTIDIGYAHMLVDERLNLGVIDVPGHEKFIRNMVAGATGFGLVLLVVAADDGVMPQTREHLEIMEILGLDRGLCVVTKIDMVEEELVELVEEELLEFVAGTFLEGAPVFRVSSVTGAGIPELRRAVEGAVRDLPGPSSRGIFRLPVQRSFSSRGQGTVITGVAVSGTLDLGADVEVAPSGLRGRVKAMEAYGKDIVTARAGHRSALNLVGIDYRDIRRGDVIAAPGYLSGADLVTARFTHLSSAAKVLKNQAYVRFHTGTFDTVGRLFLLGERELAPGRTDFVQFRLESPAPVAAGDRFIARMATPAVTIGGGTVLSVNPRRLKPRRPWILQDLAARHEALASPTARVLFQLEAEGLATLTVRDLSRKVVLPPAEVKEVLQAEADRVLWVQRGEKVLSARHFARAAAAVESELDRHHEAHPLRFGLDKVALRSVIGAERKLFDDILEQLVEQGRVRLRGSLVSRPGFEPALAPDEAQAAEDAAALFREGAFSPPDRSAALACMGRAVPAEEILRHLLEKGELVDIGGGLLFHASTLRRAEDLIRERIESAGELVSSDFRDLTGTTRKFAIPLLEYFDGAGLTVRLDNKRVLRDHGSKL